MFIWVPGLFLWPVTLFFETLRERSRSCLRSVLTNGTWEQKKTNKDSLNGNILNMDTLHESDVRAPALRGLRTEVFGAPMAWSAQSADRLFPSFEPIRYGWFSELAELSFVLILSFLLFKISAALSRQQTILTQKKIRMEEVRRMRHDVRHHFMQPGVLLQDGDADGAGDRRGYTGGLAQLSSYRSGSTSAYMFWKNSRGFLQPRISPAIM